MNWFVFSEAPKWTWLHALKPTYNSEASGYGLGFWRPYDDNSTTTGIEKGYWKYNYYNWNSLAGRLSGGGRAPAFLAMWADQGQ
jgi:hypothetical protein